MDPSGSSSSSKGKKRYAMHDGKLVQVVLLSDIDDDLNPLRTEDIDWQAWDAISPSEIGIEDEVTSTLSRLGLSSTPSESPWANLLLDPFVAAEERALRLGPSPAGGATTRRWAAYVVYNGRRMGVFLTWEAASIQVNLFSFSSYKGYNTVEEARDHWRHALVTGTWGDPRQAGSKCSLPPFDGYHILSDASIDDSAMRLSEVMQEKTSLRSQFDTKPDHIDSRLSPKPSHFASTSKGKAPVRPAFASGSKGPSRPFKMTDTHVKAGSSIWDEKLCHDLPPSRPIDNEDKYYVIQIGLQVGVCKGETEARRRLGPSQFAVMHIQATREKAKALFRKLVAKGDVFQTPSICM
ncbi:hypothetical protein BKA70DRAFT_1236427 [Coprinopsis sp. MPI-PUGE-AT-0042]|nr:hypothetical protein BKA70DRAFT_1236427 [Coprinopsis sp. MPI-PUGE-AT-0042]